MRSPSATPPQIRSRLRDDFDGAWKNMLSERRFADFIAFFLPDVYPQIDWTRPPVFLEQELRSVTRKTKRGTRSVDRLAQVWLRDGTEQWVLVHIEIQSQEDQQFPFRMFRYHFRSLDLFEGRSVFSLALLGDEVPDWRPSGYSGSLWGTSVQFAFRSIKLRDYEERLEELESDSNPFARFVLAHLKTLQTKGDYETRLQWKLRIIQGLYDMNVPEAEIGQLYHDFDWLLALPERLAGRYHREMTAFEEKRTMPHLTTAERIGRKEGRKEGIVEGKRSTLVRLMERKFGGLPEGIRTQVEQITDIVLLDSLLDRVLTADALEEMDLNAQNT